MNDDDFDDFASRFARKLAAATMLPPSMLYPRGQSRRRCVRSLHPRQAMAHDRASLVPPSKAASVSCQYCGGDAFELTTEHIRNQRVVTWMCSLCFARSDLPLPIRLLGGLVWAVTTRAGDGYVRPRSQTTETTDEVLERCSP